MKLISFHHGFLKKLKDGLGVVAHTYNPNPQGSEAGGT
jgi:hypothetical protein